MFKLVALLALAAVVSAKPGFLPAAAVVPAIETRTSVIGTQTVESHGNSVVHSAAPVVTSYAAAPVAVAAAPAIAAPVAAVAAAPLAASVHTAAVIPHSTIETHGNGILHSAPLITSYAASAPLVYSSYPSYPSYLY